MLTSEIRQTDQDGKPVSVSPQLLERVYKTDKAMHDRLGGDGSDFEYSAHWVFPEPEKAMLLMQVKIPNRPDIFSYPLPPNTLAGDPEGFVGKAVDLVLSQAGKVLQSRIDKHLRNLIES